MKTLLVVRMYRAVETKNVLCLPVCGVPHLEPAISWKRPVCTLAAYSQRLSSGTHGICINDDTSSTVGSWAGGWDVLYLSH